MSLVRSPGQLCHEDHPSNASEHCRFAGYLLNDLPAQLCFVVCECWTARLSGKGALAAALQVRLRTLAYLFFILCTVVYLFVRIGTCSSYVSSWLGFLPMQASGKQPAVPGCICILLCSTEMAVAHSRWRPLVAMLGRGKLWCLGFQSTSI